MDNQRLYMFQKKIVMQCMKDCYEICIQLFYIVLLQLFVVILKMLIGQALRL